MGKAIWRIPLMNEISTPNEFPIAYFRFLFRVTHSILLPPYKGSTFHGGFGYALSRMGRRFRDYFFRPSFAIKKKHGQALPKPFMLVPPLEAKTDYVPDDVMQCGLILFGDAIRYFMIAFAALECLGQELGLGKNKGLFQITSVEQLTLNGTILLFEDNHWYSISSPILAHEVLSAHKTEAKGLTLSLITRLRLKNDNRLVREIPPFSILFDRLIGRINSLSSLYGSGMLMPHSEKRSMLRAAQKVRMDHSGTTARWQEWTRPSKPGKPKMSFGGLLGEIGYAGELAPFIPWLALGQWTGIGGKTSFGLGLYNLDFDGGSDSAGAFKSIQFTSCRREDA
jgi:hypothetical protein